MGSGSLMWTEMAGRAWWMSHRSVCAGGTVCVCWHDYFFILPSRRCPSSLALRGQNDFKLDGTQCDTCLQKPLTIRTAVASARVTLPFALDDDRSHQGRLISQLAGIRAAKMTSTLIPLCHGLNLSKVR